MAKNTVYNVRAPWFIAGVAVLLLSLLFNLITLNRQQQLRSSIDDFKYGMSAATSKSQALAVVSRFNYETGGSYQAASAWGWGWINWLWGGGGDDSGDSSGNVDMNRDGSDGSNFQLSAPSLEESSIDRPYRPMEYYEN